MTTIPHLTPMKSSVLAGIHYDPATSKLTVKLNSGKHYQYEDVPMERAVTLEGAASPGKYWNDHIKGLYVGREIMG